MRDKGLKRSKMLREVINRRPKVSINYALLPKAELQAKRISDRKSNKKGRYLISLESILKDFFDAVNKGKFEVETIKELGYCQIMKHKEYGKLVPKALRKKVIS